MNWIIIYVIAAALLLFAIIFSNILKTKADFVFGNLSDFSPEINISSGDYAKHILKDIENTKSVKVVKFDGKKTNFYSSKYNVIKLSTEKSTSKLLNDLCLSAFLSTEAHLANFGKIFFKTKWLTKPIISAIYYMFLPLIFICAILNISSSLTNVSFYVSILALSLFILAFVFNLIFLAIEKKATKKTLEFFKKTNALNEDELKMAAESLNSIVYQNFVENTSNIFGIFKLMVPFKY